MAGLRMAAVQVWATGHYRGAAAGPGLGRVITDGFANTYYGKGIAGAMVVALIALVLEVGMGAVQGSTGHAGGSHGAQKVEDMRTQLRRILTALTLTERWRCARARR
ncbi:MAG: hypothetical protein R2734_03805 [Nocardioides sp.]